ncbi:hypothetical protein NQZ68_031390 [Dissostichus eleginoides]|nr:hypothetical protein NQZ68_031390 [Dissostichus eleginoides]
MYKNGIETLSLSRRSETLRSANTFSSDTRKWFACLPLCGSWIRSAVTSPFGWNKAVSAPEITISPGVSVGKVRACVCG